MFFSVVREHGREHICCGHVDGGRSHDRDRDHDDRGHENSLQSVHVSLVILLWLAVLPSPSVVFCATIQSQYHIPNIRFLPSPCLV